MIKPKLGEIWMAECGYTFGMCLVIIQTLEDEYITGWVCDCVNSFPYRDMGDLNNRLFDWDTCWAFRKEHLIRRVE